MYHQLLAHLIGDFMTQSSWMARHKIKSSPVALIHATVYTLPFYHYVTQSIPALLIILVSHFFIDRFGLAKYVCYAKEYLAPPKYWPRWDEHRATGYHIDTPPFVAWILLVIVDNTIHLVINDFAVKYFG